MDTADDNFNSLQLQAAMLDDAIKIEWINIGLAERIFRLAGQEPPAYEGTANDLRGMQLHANRLLSGLGGVVTARVQPKAKTVAEATVEAPRAASEAPKAARAALDKFVGPEDGSLTYEEFEARLAKAWKRRKGKKSTYGALTEFAGFAGITAKRWRPKRVPADIVAKLAAFAEGVQNPTTRQEVQS